MMSKRTITLLALLLLVGGPYASFAQQDQQATPATPYRIGIFPGGGKFGSGTLADMDQQAVRILQINIKKNPALVLAYSHYDDVLNEPRIKNRDRLWVGGQVQKKPNAEVVYRLARERGLDGVVMYWGRSSGLAYRTSRPIDLYLIDVAERKVYMSEGTTKDSDVRKMTKRVIADFVKHRPQARLAKIGEAVQPIVAKQTIPIPGGVTLVRGTLVPVELIENINTKYSNARELVYLSVTADVRVGDNVAIPTGALVKAKIGDIIKKRGTFGRAGDLSFHPVAVAALDGQWISLAQEEFRTEGAGPSTKGILGIGILAKGAAAFVLRGTQYEVIVERDAVIDTAKSKSPASLRKADFQTTARFRRVTQPIKFARGDAGAGKDFVLDITLTLGIRSLVQQDPSAVEVVEILDYVLHKPIKSIKVVLNPKKNNFISATFGWWSLVRHAQPGYTPMTVQLKLSDGRLAQAQATLDSEWKLK